MPGNVPRPGDIYQVSLEGTGRVLRGPHYAVFVSDEPFNYLSTVVTVPLSSGPRPASFRPEMPLHGKTTRALPDQIRAIVKHRLKDFQGNVADTSFFLALRIALGELFSLQKP
ncbi:MAG: type II toxin-antitoxin system PemK/MazF family toxin [Thermoanaerobacterales bacterium]|nr:type II toxin-antitoxin system PemK/MazF family toxin [Thermoanaerobacterales bacterium]